MFPDFLITVIGPALGLGNSSRSAFDGMRKLYEHIDYARKEMRRWAAQLFQDRPHRFRDFARALKQVAHG